MIPPASARGAGGFAQITAASLAELAITEGSVPWVAVKATEIDHWPA